MTRQPFYAIRVTVYTPTDTFTRDYVRGEQHVGTVAFDSFALGDLLTLTDSTTNVTWAIAPLSFEQVRDNRKYHHTTH